MKSHKTAYAMPKIISRWGSAQTPLRSLRPSPIGWGGGKLNAQISPQRLRRLASSSSATQVWRAPPKPVFWIRPFPPLSFSDIFPNCWEFLVQILQAYCTYISTSDLKFLFNYLQLWRSYAILSTTTIICSKCPPSSETLAGWFHNLIWHNFVRVGDNWIKYL